MGFFLSLSPRAGRGRFPSIARKSGEGTFFRPHPEEGA
jgi:hypothetical protein